MIALEEDAAALLDHTRAPEPFFFRANSGECIVFEATNLIPSNLNLDDFQVFSPTDTIGQHIHLVKFDVTSSDGSGNGWNYEDGTFSPDELRERIIANNAYRGVAELRPLTHRLFQPGAPLDEGTDGPGICPDALPANAAEAERMLDEHPWCGAQSTIQRWWADPLLNRAGRDRTIRTVFTHDHFGPSSHQQHGFYAALVIEPNGSSWQTVSGEPFGGQDPSTGEAIPPARADGGPTSYAANIVGPTTDGKPAFSRREFNLAVADFALLYTAPPANRPISPPGRLDHDLPQMVLNFAPPKPEGISVSDPGGQLLNYRNEPLPGRLAQEGPDGRWSLRTYKANSPLAKACEAAHREVFDSPDADLALDALRGCRTAAFGEVTTDEACVAETLARVCNPSDPANVFSSFTFAGIDDEIAKHVAEDRLFYDTRRIFARYLEPDCNPPRVICGELPGLRQPGDPATPILPVREGDTIQLRLVQGAQEENHIFFVNGMKWPAVPGSTLSGYHAAQSIGISEHFEFDVSVQNPSPQVTLDHLYGTSATDNLWDGQFGLMRVVGQARLPALARLPSPDGADVTVDQIPSSVTSTCEGHEPSREFWVEAWRLRDVIRSGETDVPIAVRGKDWAANPKAGISDPAAVVYLLARATDAAGELMDPAAPLQEYDFVHEGRKTPEPLILRANAGECIKVNLINKLPREREDVDDPATWAWNALPPIANDFNTNDLPASRAVGLHPQLMAVAPAEDGSFVGRNPDPSVVWPCHDETPCGSQKNPGSIPLTWYAGDYSQTAGQTGPQLVPIEFGAAGLMDFADVPKGSMHGLVGALVIEPEGATWETDCDILRAAGKGEGVKDCLNAAATVHYQDPDTGEMTSFREFVLVVQNDASLNYNGQPLPNLRNADDAEDTGQKTFNYRFEPFWARLGASPTISPEEMAERDLSRILSSGRIPFSASPADPTAPPVGSEVPGYEQGDPATPLFTVRAGMPVRIRLVEPAGHPRHGAFALAGHDWQDMRWTCRSDGSLAQVASVADWGRTDVSRPETCDPASFKPIDPANAGASGGTVADLPRFNGGVVNGIGPARHVNILVPSAGGPEQIAGDYLYNNPVGFSFGGGQWGIMRVFGSDACSSPGDADGPRTHLDDRTGRTQVCW